MKRIRSIFVGSLGFLSLGVDSSDFHCSPYAERFFGFLTILTIFLIDELGANIFEGLKQVFTVKSVSTYYN